MVNKWQIVHVGNISVQRINLQLGNNVIGQGALTGQVDKPIVENAVTIHLAPNGKMTMTPMLACSIKSPLSSHWKPLEIGRKVPVQTGDIWSLASDKSWFKIISNDSDDMEDDDIHGKRKAMNSSTEEPPEKKLREEASTETIYSQSKSVLDEWDDDETDCGSNGAEINENSESPPAENSVSNSNGNPSVEVLPAASNNTTDNTDTNPARRLSTSQENNNSAESSKSKDNSNENHDEAGKKIKWDCGQHFSDQTDQQTDEAAGENGEASGTSEENRRTTAEATVASDDPPRNKCAYGSQCYRRNSEHRATFSHPGDPDYDIPDDRPECPYGIRCYRKNPQHKRDFKHTSNRRNRAQTPVRVRTPNGTSGTEQSSAEESVDESEYEPSLATSDDYESDFERSDFDYDATSDPEDKE